MTEEENVSVETQESQAVAQAAESETEHDDRQEKPKQAEPRKRNEAEHNWAETRRKMQELESKNREMQEQLTRLVPKPVPQEEDYGIEDDAIVEGKHVKSLKKELSELKSYIKQRETATVDERVNLKYPDYAEVVTQENIELLKQTEPELAMSIYHTPDPYNQAVAAYKLLKKVSNKPEQTNSLERKKAQENTQKPVSVQAVTKSSAIGNAHLFENGLTTELKAQLLKEMRDAVKFG